MSSQSEVGSARRGLQQERGDGADHLIGVDRSRRLGPWSLGMAGIALGILALFAIMIVRNSPWWLGADADTYYLAAERLRDGEPLYVDTPSLHIGNYYRYAPWFAMLFIPFTALPRELVVGGFAILALACCLAVLWPLLRPLTPESVGLLFLVGPALVHFSFMGNVHAPLVAAIMYLPGRPLWIAAAASLKFTPLALILPDVARGRWKNAALCFALTAAFTLPILAFDLSRYVSDTERQIGTWGISPWLTIGLGVAGSVATLFIAGRDYRLGMAAAAATVVLAAPYLIIAYLSWLIIPLSIAARGNERPSSAGSPD